MMHKNSQKMHVWFPWQHFERKHEVIIVFRLSVGRKFASLYFVHLKLKFCSGVFLGGNFKTFHSKNISIAI